MTEYDFSPEAYQAHLANMSRISKWVDRTEEHRPEFTNAAALTEQRAHKASQAASPSPSPERRNSFGGRRRKIPPPLPLHPYGTPDPAYVAMGMGMVMSPYASPMHSADDHEMGFAYATGPGSPGPMSPHMHGYPSHQVPHSAGVMMMMQPPLMSPPIMSPPLMSPPLLVPQHHHHPRRGRSSSFSLAAPPPVPNAPYMSMGMGMGMASPPPGYGQAGPSYVMLPPTPSRHHRSGRHRIRPEVSYVYV